MNHLVRRHVNDIRRYATADWRFDGWRCAYFAHALREIKCQLFKFSWREKCGKFSNYTKWWCSFETSYSGCPRSICFSSLRHLVLVWLGLGLVCKGCRACFLFDGGIEEETPSQLPQSSYDDMWNHKKKPLGLFRVKCACERPIPRHHIIVVRETMSQWRGIAFLLPPIPPTRRIFWSRFAFRLLFFLPFCLHHTVFSAYLTDRQMIQKHLREEQNTRWKKKKKNTHTQDKIQDKMICHMPHMPHMPCHICYLPLLFLLQTIYTCPYVLLTCSCHAISMPWHTF